MTTVPSLVLASGSPRRKELLSMLGIPFTVRPADLDETPHPGEAAQPYVGRLSVEKALAVAQPGELVLAADTTVALDGEILGKPLDVEDAVATLMRLSGRPHQTHTGMAVVDGTTGAVLHQLVDTTQVHMRTYDEVTARWYVATGEPLDRAGSYAVQGIGSTLVARVDGNVQTVVGLTMTVMYEWLHHLIVTTA
jgi:septum formation protein